MIPILLTLTFEHVRLCDVKHTDIPVGNSLQPINLRAAIIDAAEQTFGKDHDDTNNIKDAFVTGIWHDYMLYVDHSLKYFYSLLFRSALMKAKQSIEAEEIDYTEVLAKCNEKSNSLCNKILFYMNRLQDGISVEVVKSDKATEKEFDDAIGNVIDSINKQQRYFISIYDIEQIRIERINLYFEVLTTELENACVVRPRRWESLKCTIALLKTDADSNFEPIASSKFLDKLTIFKGGLEFDA